MMRRAVAEVVRFSAVALRGGHGCARRLDALAIGYTLDVEGDHVLGEAIDEWHDTGRTREGVRPVLEGEVGGDDLEANSWRRLMV